MDEEAERIAKLTNVQIIDVLHTLTKRVGNLEAVAIALGDAFNELNTHWGTETLRTRLENMEDKKKTPYRRIEELEASFSGLVKFINSKEPQDAHKKKRSDIKTLSNIYERGGEGIINKLNNNREDVTSVDGS